MFDGKYFDWNAKRIKGIVDFYGHQFFYNKKVADLGCGYADISGVLYRFGSQVTAVDARQEHLKVVAKKFPGVKIVRANLDQPWPFFGQKFDVILDLGLLCHLANFEEHLKVVCATTTYLILETAVCDSDDPNKSVQMPESKDSYDLSFNGMGCRPTAAAIERVLTSCGFSFKRMDQTRFNSGDYVYDWQLKNDNSTNLSKRRIWFASKNEVGLVTPYVGTQPAVVMSPPINMSFQNTRNRAHVLTGSQHPSAYNRMNTANMLAGNHANGPGSPNIYHNHEALHLQVTKNTKEFSMITPENYTPSATFDTSGVIWPITLSSRMWMKKIAPLFPSLTVSGKDITMFNFAKSNDAPNVIMCSINALVPYSRIWIEEWKDVVLDETKINVLRQCQTIMTPSLLNAQQILAAIPDANVQRFGKVWPMMSAEPNKYDYLLYFEKDPRLTDTLFSSWDDKFGKLIVVGSQVKLPSFAEFVSDTANYTQLSILMMGAKAVIDISDNNYYMSGVLGLASAMSLPIITNNQAYINKDNSVIIKQDTSYPASDDIRQAINKFITEVSKTPAKFNANYNSEVNDMVRKLIGI